MPCTSPDSDATRVSLVQSHFTAQCPCLVQTAVLLTAILHERSRDVSSRAACSVLPTIGSTLPRPRAEVGGKAKRTQAQTIGGAAHSISTDRPPRRRRVAAEQNPHDNVPASHQTRSGPSSAEARRLFHDLLQQGAVGRPAHPDSTGPELASGHGVQDEPSLQHAAETTSQEEPLGGIGQTSPASCKDQEGRGALETGGPEPIDAGGRQLALHPMGSPTTEDHLGQKDPGQYDQNVGACPGAPRNDLGSHHGHAIPCTSEQSEGTGCSVAPPAEHASRRCLQPPAPAQSLCSLAATGSITEAPFPDPESLSDSVAGSPWPQTQRERQGQGQEVSPGCKAGGLEPYTSKDFLTALSTLVLNNGGNWRYLNATFCSSLWALLTVNQTLSHEWGGFLTTLAAFLFPIAVVPKDLTQEPWIQQVLVRWGAMNQAAESQQDSAECVMMFLDLLKAPALDLRWAKRCEISACTAVFDLGCRTMPIRLQFTDAHDFTDVHTHIPLSFLIDSWHQADGMYTSLLQPSPVVCFHVDRFLKVDDNLTKCAMPLQLTGECWVPVFLSDDIKSEKVAYVPVAAMAHFGNSESGHYRALMRIQPCVHAQNAAEWLLTDDNPCPQTHWHVPLWFSQNITFIWLIRADVAVFHTFQGSTHNAEQALLDLLPPVAHHAESTAMPDP